MKLKRVITVYCIINPA